LGNGGGIAPTQPPTAPAAPVPSAPGSAADRPWKDAIFRAIFYGERNVNELITLGRAEGGPNEKTVRAAVLDYLKVPFPKSAQAGAMPCKQHEVRLDDDKPDLRREGIHPDPIFTGRYESTKAEDGSRYSWAINQAGRAVIAIRTMRDFGKASRDYLELRGDLQSDGTAVLFRSDQPQAFWGYIQLLSAGSINWNYGSYLGSDGKRVFAAPDASPSSDEVLHLESDRPTMMESLFKSDDNYLSVLLQQREWYPLTEEVSEFLEDGAGSNALRLLIDDYFKRPGGPQATFQENQAKDAAAARIVNYLGHLLWDGAQATKPYGVTLPPELEQACGQELQDILRLTFKVIPHGHHNNLVLATYVAKVRLAREKLNRGGQQLSFLDWLTKLASERLAAGWKGEKDGRALSKLLELALDPTRAVGTYQYHLKFDAYQGGPFVLGTLLVEKLTPPKWRLLCDVSGGNRPHIPGHDTVFDITVETPQEWTPEDFEGFLFLLELDLSAQAKRVKVGVTWKGCYFRSNSGMILSFDNAKTSAGPGGGGKPKIGKGWDALVGHVTRKTPDAIIDFSKPFPGSQKVLGNLDSTPHFCFDSALLTPAARQFLRYVCADRLAVLTSDATQIVTVGHTDRPADSAYNLRLSELRAKNVAKAMKDILGDVLPIRWEDIHAIGLGEVAAVVLDLLKARADEENVPRPEYRYVDLLIDFSLVARLRPQLKSP